MSSSFYGESDLEVFGGGSSSSATSTAALEKSFATGAKSISDNNLVGINANNISMILESLNKYREGINKEVIELTSKNLEVVFGQNILEKLRGYVSKITDLCIDFLNAYEPFSVKLDYVREVYEKEKQKQKDQVGGVVTGNGVVVVDGEIKASYLKGADKVSAGYSNPLEQVKVISNDAIPEAGMTMDEVVDYWSKQGRLGNGDERKQKCEELGLDYYAIQDKINERYGYGPTEKPEGYRPTVMKTQAELDAEEEARKRARFNMGNTGDAGGVAFEKEKQRILDEASKKSEEGNIKKIEETEAEKRDQHKSSEDQYKYTHKDELEAEKHDQHKSAEDQYKNMHTDDQVFSKTITRYNGSQLETVVNKDAFDKDKVINASTNYSLYDSIRNEYIQAHDTRQKQTFSGVVSVTTGDAPKIPQNTLIEVDGVTYLTDVIHEDGAGNRTYAFYPQKGPLK